MVLYEKFVFVDQRHTKKPRGPKVLKRMSIFVCGSFIFQPIFLHVPYKKIFFSMGHILYGFYRSQDTCTCIKGPTPTISLIPYEICCLYVFQPD